MTSIWSNRRYVSWLVSDTAKGVSSGLFGFAVPLLALIITDDPVQAGVIGAVGMGTRVALMLFGGVLADRHRRVTLMVLGAVIGVVLSAAFTLLALGDALTFGTLLTVDALLAARTALLDVAGESLLKDIVAPETMGRAQAANRARDAALELAGGPVGGTLLAIGGWLIGVVMTACHLVSAVAAWLIPRLRGPVATDAPAAPRPPVDGAAPRTHALREIRDGLSWLFSRTDLRGVLFISTIINLGINTATTTVIYALQQDGYSPAVIGWVGAAMGAGMLLGALFAGWAVSRIGAGVIMLITLVVLTAGAGALALVHSPVAIVAVFLPAALLLAPVNAALGGYQMVATPTELIGRVSSASGVFALGAMPLAPLIAGFGLAHLGRGGAILIGAGLCAAAALLGAGNRGLRSLPAESGWAEHAAQFEVAAPSASVS
ncbi:MFS transporter [Microbacterium soli]|uniref:Major facilitator superfamily (MFS) profile domain-containing protein n=1 Tax=Microbacterium soli TaxID=446075 RepID=A0ABP7N0Q3_9MICO